MSAERNAGFGRSLYSVVGHSERDPNLNIRSIEGVFTGAERRNMLRGLKADSDARMANRNSGFHRRLGW